MKPLTQLVEDVARDEALKGGFDAQITIKTVTTEPCFEAETKIDGKEVHIAFNAKYEDEHPGKLPIVIRDIARHEVNHHGYRGFNGCPRNVDYHARKIVEPMAEVLLKKGFSMEDVHYAANALEDTILHADLAGKFELEGVAAFFADVGHHTDNKKFTEFYEAHVKLNTYLFGNKSQRAQVAPYFAKKDNKADKESPKTGKKDKHSPSEVQQVLQAFIKRSGLGKFKQAEETHWLHDRLQAYLKSKNLSYSKPEKQTLARDRSKMRDYLNDENNWEHVAKVYAEEFSKLMKPGYAMPLPDHEGKGTKGHKEPQEGDGKTERDKQHEASPGKGSGKKSSPPQPPQSGNPFDKQMYDKEFKKKRVQEAHANGSPAPNWIDQHEAMDLLYQSMAQRLKIKVETYTHQDRLPVCHYGKRPFDPEKDNFKHTTFGFNDKGQVELQKRRWHESIPLAYKVQPKGFPEARFCLLDTSISMQASPDGGPIGNTSIIPWGDNSKYHYALLSWYGLLEYLKDNHLLQQMSVALANFSNETVIGQGLEAAKRIALSPQFGGTRIDVAKVKTALKGHGMLMFSVSDGEIDQWSSISKKYIELAKNHHYFHLQLGGPSEMSNDLESAGLKVVPVNDAADLANTVIDLTDALYRGRQ